MKRSMNLLMVAAAMAIAPAAATAAPGGSHGGPGMHASPTTAPAAPKSPTGNGGGYNHTNAPQHATGQPSQSCETTGSPPGRSASSPGSPFNEEGGKAGTQYAGEKPQNSRNTASVSQYDVACANQPH